MAQSLEERVAYLEGKVDEHSRGFGEIRELIMHLDQKVDRFREELSGRIDALEQRLMGRLDATNGRIDALDQRLTGRIDGLEQRLTGRIDALDEKFSRYFLWTIGIQITVLLAVIGALLSR